MSPASEWPPLTHPHTLERLRISNLELPSLLPDLIALMPQTFQVEPLEARVQRALSYPWERPTAACLISGGEILPDGEIDDGQRRHPVIAIGSNASPPRLALKFADLEPSPIRLVPGLLADFDVCAAPTPTPYGAFPAILTESPGTRVEVALTWLTEPQIELLTLSEFGYWFGRLDGIELETQDGLVHHSALVYAGRLGLYRAPGGEGSGVDAEPAALAAIPAQGRRFSALTQQELLDDCAARVGIGGDGDGLLQAIFDDHTVLTRGCYPPLLAAALPTSLPGFTPHPLP